MNNLERAVKSGIRSIEKRVEKNIRVEIYNIIEWHGKKILSVEKWKNLCSKTKDVKVLMEYFPDEYIDHIFLGFSMDKQEEKDLESWFDDWTEYLHEKKRASFGKYICRSCILNPDHRKYSDNIHEVVMKGTDAEYPCKVVNIYECPYKENEENIRALQSLKKIWEVTLAAISHNEYLIHNNNKTFFADFEKNHGEEYFNLHLSSQPNCKFRLSDGILELDKLTRIPHQTINDLYNILTDMKLLGAVIDQYIQHIKNDSSYSTAPEIAAEVKELELMKKVIISYFSSIKEKIKLEELRNGRGMNVEQQKIEIIESKKHHEWFGQRFPDQVKYRDKPRNGLCMTCFGFANILCVNCNKWICNIHWKEHGEKFHNKPYNL